VLLTFTFHVLSSCLSINRRFWHFVSQQPVRILEVPDDQTEQEPVQMEAPRFMAVVWGAGQDGDGPTTIVQLDGQGGLANYVCDSPVMSHAA
jgi:hypothetical protein